MYKTTILVKFEKNCKLDHKRNHHKEVEIWWSFYIWLSEAISVKCRSSHSQMFIKVGFSKNFTIFTGKYLCWILFAIKLASNFIKQVFSCEYCEFFRSSFIEHLLWLLLKVWCSLRASSVVLWSSNHVDFKLSANVKWQ